MKITVAANPGRTARTSSIRRLTTLSLMTAIIILMAYTPIGYIDLPLIKATLIHVPVILGALLLGPADGLFLGGVFGVTSILKNTMAPAILSFAFSPLVPVPGTQSGSPWALFICFVPRMLIGVTPWLVCRGLERIASGRLNHTPIPAAVAGDVGNGHGLSQHILQIHCIRTSIEVRVAAGAHGHDHIDGLGGPVGAALFCR